MRKEEGPFCNNAVDRDPAARLAFTALFDSFPILTQYAIFLRRFTRDVTALAHSASAGTASANIFPQQIRLLYSGGVEGLLATAINALLLAYIQRDVIAGPIVGWWLLYMALVTLARAALVYRYWRSQDTERNAARWNRAYGMGAALAGLGWGAAGIILYPSGSIAHQVFLVFMLGGMAAGAVAVLTARMEIFLVFFLPTLLPIIGQLIGQPGALHLTMGGALLIFMLALLFTARRMHYTIVSSLMLRTENTGLVHYLTAANAQAEQLNKELKEEIEQHRQTETALQSSQEQLLQSQKMEAIGQLAGGIAHDFNNLILVMNGYSELLLDELKADEGKRLKVEQIKQAGDRAAALTHKMLAFSRRQVTHPRPIDLNAVVSSITPMLTRLIGEPIHIVTKLPPIGQVKADPMEIEQVIMNLVLNARDAMPHGGALTIETADVELDRLYTGQHRGSQVGTYVQLTVRDTGIGMDAETKRRVFEPFFTTKAVGKGTGLGLSVVYGIIKQSGGYIEVTSEPGTGSLFKVYLPRMSSAVALSHPPVAERSSATSRESILVVEDEPAVRSLISNLLREKGHDVLEASDGDEALRTIEQAPNAIHLLITDLVMPRLGGSELAQRLRLHRPHVKVLYMSGYSDDTLLRQEGLPKGADFLQKPFTPDVLSCKVREVLDKRGAGVQERSTAR
jgi:signal transduction histidine kinase/ActR/RegA family two-component response regulator